MLTLKNFNVIRQEAVLSNGCRVVLFKRPNAPIYLTAHFFSGSRFDPKGKDGMAHYLEHMLVAGTKNFKTKDKLAEYIEQYGGVFGAFTNGDELAVNVEIGDPKDLGIAIKVLNETLLNSLFSENTFNNEKRSIFKEIGDRNSNPSRRLWDVYRKLYFQNTPAGRYVLGTEETLNSITNSDIIEFFKDKITSGRMLLVASGGIDIKEVGKLSERELFVSKSPEFYLKDDLPIIRKDRIAIEKYKDQDQVHLMLGFRSGSIFDESNPALGVVASVLGGGRASTLVRKLRYEKGLVYNASASQIKLSDSGTWAISTSTSKDKVQEVINIITAELNKVVENGLTEKEIAFAKNKIIKSKFLQMQTSDDWVSFHSYPELVGKKGWTIIDHIEEINSITNEGIIKAARKIFLKDMWYLAMCGDIEQQDVEVSL